MKSKIILLLAASCIGFCPVKAAGLPEDSKYSGYLMVYFNDATHSLFFAVSDDGYSFKPVNEGNPVFEGKSLGDQKGIRDPYMMRGPDGAFYMALTDLHIFARQHGLRTTDWERPFEQFDWGNNRAIVMMKSKDLVTWTKSVFYVDKAFPEEWSDVGCIWAPAIAWDNEKGCPVVYVTMRHGRGRNQVYWSTADVAFTKLTSAPKKVMTIPSDDGKGEGSYIDGDVVYWKGKYHFTYTPHTRGGPGVKHAASDKATEGFVFEDKWIDIERRACEAPTMWRRLGTDSWVLMYDRYGERPHNFGFMETEDFENWRFIGRFNEPGSPMKLIGAAQPKHGAVVHLTAEEMQRVRAMNGGKLK